MYLERSLTLPFFFSLRAWILTNEAEMIESVSANKKGKIKSISFSSKWDVEMDKIKFNLKLQKILLSSF